MRSQTQVSKAPKGDAGRIAFPQQAIVGSLGDLARELAGGTEVSEEFVFATAMTCLGAMVSGKLTLKIGLNSDTRLYTILLGESATTKKSSAMGITVKLFESISSAFPWKVLNGAGSAEGVARELKRQPNILLVFDELRAFADKIKVQNSVLLPMAAKLFESYDYDNPTKNESNSVRNARLSIVGCCTPATYEQVWSRDAIALGFTNRLFVIHADGRPRVSWPTPPDHAALEAIKRQIQMQLAKLPFTLDIAPDAKLLWDDWYQTMPNGEHVKRLDTIGFRLLAILALTLDKEIIDLEVVSHVIAILKYEFDIRTITDPIDADNVIAAIEQRILRALRVRGPLSNRFLRQFTHAHRAGLWAFDKAIQNLMRVNDVTYASGVYYLAEDGLAEKAVDAIKPGGAVAKNVSTALN